MHVRSRSLHVTCHPDDHNTVEIGKRIYNADLVHLRTIRGELIAAPITCAIFSLPAVVDIRPMESAELFPVDSVAKRLHRKPVEVRRAAGRYRLGRMYGNQRMLSADEVARLADRMKMATAPKRRKKAK